MALVTLFGLSLMQSPAYAVNDLDLNVAFTPVVTAVPGAFVTAAVILTNNTSVDISGVALDLSYTNQFLDYSGNTGGFTCTVPTMRYSNTMKCTAGLVPAGQSVTVNFSGTAPDGYTVPTYGLALGVTATATPGNLQDSDTIIIADAYKPDLAVISTSSVSNTTVGTVVTYTAKIYSNGPLPAPANTLLVEYPDLSNETIIIPALDSQQTTSFTVNYRPLVAGNAVVKFTVDPDNVLDEEYESNNISSKTVIVASALPDLTVSATHPSPVSHSTIFTQTVTARNLGTAPASGVVVKDLAINFGFSSYVADHGFTCAATKFRVGRSARYNPNGYQCSGGILAPGETVTLTINMVANSALGTYSHNLSIDPSNKIVEQDENNNIFFITQTVN